MKKIEIKEKAIKDLKRIDKKFQNQIKEKIEELSKFPNINGLKKLTNFEPAYRYRVGNYRILFDVIDNTIFIVRIKHRRESYK